MYHKFVHHSSPRILKSFGFVEFWNRFQRPLCSTMSNGNRGTALIAVSQMTVGSDKESNFKTCHQLIQEASSAGAKMIFLPEASDYIAESHSRSLELAEDEDGPLVRRLCDVARQCQIWISIGSFHCRRPDGAKTSNRHLVVNSDGLIAARYDKVHLFDMELPDKKLKLKESDYVEPGAALAELVDSPVGKIGLGICYDLRFAEFSLSLARCGAEVLTYPSAFTVPTGTAHWESLLRCRAIETQCYVVAAAQTGQHNSKRSSYGHAMVVDPWGAVVAQCREGTGIALATIDLTYLDKVRREMPVLSHRRPHLYSTEEFPSRKTGAEPELESDLQFGQVTVRGRCVFHRSRRSAAFVNRKCVVPGHVLVIPLRPALRLVDLTADEVADLFQTAQHVQRGMELFHGVSSSTLTVQDGPDAGQTVRHVHVHILPRRPGDFQRNDDIYERLQDHDRGQHVQWRPDDEMHEEAQLLRTFFQDLPPLDQGQ